MKHVPPHAVRPRFDDLPDWVSPLEARRYLGVSHSFIYTMLQTKQLPSRRFGRILRIPKAALSPEAAVRNDAQ
jgi:excisionase family DNA binding protein